MVKKNNDNNVLYWIIAVLVLVIVWLLGYFLWQNGNSNNTVVTTWSDTPLVVEAWKIGIDTDDLKKCIAENKFLDKINSQMEVGAQNFGISWTPWNVLINNKTWEYVVISWAHPKETFIKNIDKLLSDNTTVVENETPASEKTFTENTDENTITIISDKRDTTIDTNLLIADLKKVEPLKDMTIVEYNFYDDWVQEFLKENNIKKLPLVIFAKNSIDQNIDQHLTKLNNDSYSLNIWASFDPFEKLSPKGFKMVDSELLNEIKANSYIDWEEDSKITWLEYSDLECPYCAKLHNSDVESTLKAKYGDDINIIFNHFPLGFHQKAIPWANILECVWELGWDEAFYKILKYAYKNKIQE